MYIPNEIVNKIIMLAKPTYPFLEELEFVVNYNSMICKENINYEIKSIYEFLY